MRIKWVSTDKQDCGMCDLMCTNWCSSEHKKDCDHATGYSKFEYTNIQNCNDCVIRGTEDCFLNEAGNCNFRNEYIKKLSKNPDKYQYVETDKTDCNKCCFDAGKGNWCLKSDNHLCGKKGHYILKEGV